MSDVAQVGLARPVGGTERLVRWCRRRPVTAGLLVALALVTACGLGGVVWQWRRANRAAAVARQERDTADRERARAEAHLAKSQDAIDFISRRIADGKLAHTPHAQGVQREMLEYALRFHESMLREAGDGPATQSAAADAYLRTGAIRRAVGDTKAAEDAFQNAIARYQGLVMESPDSADYRRGLITGWNELATLWSQLGRAPEAANAFDRIETLLASASTEARLSEIHRSCQASVHLNRAVDHLERREHAKAEPQLRAALALSEGLAKDDPQNEHYQEQLAAVLASLGVVFRHTNRGAEATEAYRRAIATREDLVSRNPLSLSRRTNLGTTYRNFAILKRTMGATEDAREQNRRAQGIFDRLADDFPDLPRYRSELAQTLFGLAVTYSNPEECTESVALLEKAVGHQRRVVSMNGQNPSYRDEFRRMTINLAVAQADLGLHQRAADGVIEFIRFATASQDYVTAVATLDRCMGLVAADASLPLSERALLADRYARQACEVIRTGEGHFRIEMATLRIDPKFAALRGNKEFQQFLAGSKE